MRAARRCQCCLVFCGVVLPAVRAADKQCASRGAVDDDVLPAREKNILQSHSELRQVANDSQTVEDGVKIPYFRFQKYGDERMLPRIYYPLTRDTVPQLAKTKAVSPRWLEHNQVKRALKALGPSPSFKDMEDEIWGSDDKGSGFAPSFKPTHPDVETGDDELFWREFSEVVAAQLMRKHGNLTKHVMPVHPLFDSEETMEKSAQRVRADFPTEFPVLQIQRFLSQKDGFKLDANIFRRSDCESTKKEFVNGAVALSALAGWAVSEVSPAAFASKWHVGRLRPEEAALRVREGSLLPPNFKVVDGVDCIFNAVLCMPGSNCHPPPAASFTAYKEGSPMHPSWPAMHSAASSVSTWLDVVADLTEEQRAEVRLLDYSIAYFRTFAGVHYPSDNRAGLALGQHIIRSKLADHLAVNYACDADSEAGIKKYVQDKIDNLPPLDWAVWTPEKWNPPSLYFGR